MRTMALFAGILLTTAAMAEDPNAGYWPKITAQCRPGGYWWWMGSAVNRGDLTREMERYHAAGMGGVHIIPIYGAVGYEKQYIEYLSPQWMEMLRHVATEARRLDMFADMTTGTGWCFGGPNVTPRDACAVLDIKTTDASKRQRFDRQSVQALMAFGPGGCKVDLLDRITANGTLDWTPPEGAWQIISVSQKPWRGAVKRSAPGGAGPMLNPFAVDSMPHYLERFTRAFAAYEGPRPRAMYHDSYEYGATWSPDVLAEFARRRGYRLQDELPALASKQGDDHVARVKSDYRETLSDIMVDRFIPPWVEWCRKEGFVSRYQAHGSPANLLDLYALADIPETEMFHNDRSTLVSKFASSAAHVQGRQLTAAETGTWLKEHFTETLADVKDLVDQMFLAGVNHVIYHGTCYSPDDAPWPGWVFYASTQMNPRNSIWRDVRTLNDYIARCQAILQSGQPDNDLLVYWPVHDVWHESTGLVQQFTVHHRFWIRDTPAAAVSERLLSRGYTFDYVSDRQIIAAHAAAGKIVVPGGSYRAIVVPRCNHMPVETLSGLLALAEGGATVIFVDALPADVPGAGRLEARREEFKKLLGKVILGETKKLTAATVGKGRAVVGDVEAALALAGVPRETLADIPGLQFIRRKVDTKYFSFHYYFLANRGEKPIDQWVPLADDGFVTVYLDPMTGKSRGGTEVLAHGEPRKVYLQLPPGASIILHSNYQWPTGAPAPEYSRSVGNPIDLAGRWRIKFISGGPELPSPVTTGKLVSWTQFGGPKAEALAGTACYRLEFDAPAGVNDHWLLDLGSVCQSARVRLNGQSLGTLIQPPFQVRIEKLKTTGNVLEVEVTNVSANRIRDLDRRGVRWKAFHEINLVNIDYKPFDASKWPLTDSGLLGPVRLTRQKVVLP